LKIITGGWDYWLPGTTMEGQKKVLSGRVQGMKKNWRLGQHKRELIVSMNHPEFV
jgi:hypothetical protein